MHQQKVSDKFKELLGAAPILVSSKAELTGERKTFVLTKGRNHDNNIDMRACYMSNMIVSKKMSQKQKYT